MRSDTEIENEIHALKLALEQNKRNEGKSEPYKSKAKFRSSCYPSSAGFWNARLRDTVEHSIKVLTERMSAEAIRRYYYGPETAEDYSPGDNVMFKNMMYVHAWMNGEANHSAPSKSIVETSTQDPWG